MNVVIGHCTEKDLTSLKNMFHNVDSNMKCTHAIYSRLFLWKPGSAHSKLDIFANTIEGKRHRQDFWVSSLP